MALHLDVVCTDLRLTSQDRRKQTVRAISEILPLVLAKYGVGTLKVAAATSHKQNGHASRFQVR
jgi:hypothetical protein